MIALGEFSSSVLRTASGRRRALRNTKSEMLSHRESGKKKLGARYSERCGRATCNAGHEEARGSELSARACALQGLRLRREPIY